MIVKQTWFKLANIMLFIANLIFIGFNAHFLCKEYPNNGNLGFDYMGIIVGILSLLVTLLIGWNIYTVIDFKQQSQHIHDKANKIIESHTILSETLDKRFEDFENKFDMKITEAKESAGLVETYKRAVDFVEQTPEVAFRDFIDIIIPSKKLNEIKLMELALSMAEYIARRDDLEPKISEAANNLTEQKRKAFFSKTIQLINSLSDNPSDFEELRHFVTKIYNQ